MAEGPSHQQQQHHHLLLHRRQPPPLPPQRSRLGGGGGLRSIPGEIVEVQGGHIVRSTGRKDRHSKVCTAKGPRDRRVRLSAQTAIQFYDVQDRLGYDRPSKAVDWLIKNAKAAIDELDELPAWHPTATATAMANPPVPPSNQLDSRDEATDEQMHVAAQGRGSSSQYEFGGGGGGSSSFLPPSLDSDAIADTIKSFFPMAAAAAAAAGGGSNSSASTAAPSSSSPIGGFQNYPPDLLSRTSSQSQDLRLSLQSFQDPIFHHPSAASAQHHHQHHQATNAAGHHGLFSGFEASAMAPWNVQESSGGIGGSGNVGGGGYVFNVPLQLQHQPQAVAMHPGLGHGHGQSQSQSQFHFFSQRGPLQSSNPPFVRAWADPMAAAADHLSMNSPIHPSIGLASGSSGFSGFRIPARFQGEEEEEEQQQHDGISDKPSSASSGSHH